MNGDGGIIAEFFERDHDEVDALLNAVPFAEPARAAAPFDEFIRRLERHIDWEETILFPAAAQAAPMLGAGPIPVMLSEHERIRDAMTSIRESLARGDGGGARAGVLRLLSVLGPHNEKEEKILYPSCDAALSPAAAEKILARVRAGAGNSVA
jgi:iron-sulfur cluster repair protein YtfE (RIC family)